MGILTAASDCERGCFKERENSGLLAIVGLEEGVCLGVWGGFGFNEDEMVRYEWEGKRKRVAGMGG